MEPKIWTIASVLVLAELIKHAFGSTLRSRVQAAAAATVDAIWRQVSCEVTLDSDDPVWSAVLSEVTARLESRRVRLSTCGRNFTSAHLTTAESGVPDAAPTYTHLDDNSWYVLTWNGYRFWANVTRTSTPTMFRTPVTGGQLRLLRFGRRLTPLERFLTMATTNGQKRDWSGVKIYTSTAFDTTNGGWGFGKVCLGRSLSSVVMDQAVLEDVLKDMQTFIASEAKYAARCLPYRRGYCFYGPPGCGKTTLIRALATALGYDICLPSHYDEERFSSRVRELPRRCLLVLEDITESIPEAIGMVVPPPAGDAFTEMMVANTGLKPRGGLSLGTLLNCLDGATTPRGLIVIATTNHVDRLVPNLQRRFDKKVFFDGADADKARRMFVNVHALTNENDPRAQSFGEHVGRAAKQLSMNAVQEHCIRHMDDPDECLKRVEELFTV